MSDPNQSPLLTVEQGTADEADIQEQVDAASEVPAKRKSPPQRKARKAPATTVKKKAR
jgi:hypothetical protein